MAAVRQFGATWWGRAWIDALEHRAQVDPNRLPRGRTYARQDRVARLELAPGRITALVRGNRALPYRVTVAVPTIGPDGWSALAAALAARASGAAALLDGELDPLVVADADAAGVRLLPGPGDLSPRCSCPDWADPCKHAAAVLYVAADAIDADPFALVVLRGGTRDELMELVRAHRAAGAAGSSEHDDVAAVDGDLPGTGPGGTGPMVADAFGGGAVVDPGTVARVAWQRDVPPPPERPPLPAEPGHPAGWPADPPRDAPFTAAGLTELAADAAGRAWAQLADRAPSHLELDEDADLARLAAARLGRLDDLLVLARRTGVPSAQLTHRALAWRNAGAAGLAAVDEALWRPPPTVVEQGLAAFEATGLDPEEVHVRSNRFTYGDVQLRATSDGRWWRYERQGRTWELAEPPSEDPEDLLSPA